MLLFPDLSWLKKQIKPVGGKVEEVVGAAVDARYAPPLLIAGIVESIVQGDSDAEVEVWLKR
jgi:hypothetical protein